MHREPAKSPWEIIYRDGYPMGTVRKVINPRTELFSAYRALPVCRGLNWNDTYPDYVFRAFKNREDAIAWVMENDILKP